MSAAAETIRREATRLGDLADDVPRRIAAIQRAARRVETAADALIAAQKAAGGASAEANRVRQFASAVPRQVAALHRVAGRIRAAADALIAAAAAENPERS